MVSLLSVITILFAISLVGMFLVLYTMFRSANLALLQIIEAFQQQTN